MFYFHAGASQILEHVRQAGLNLLTNVPVLDVETFLVQIFAHVFWSYIP